MELPKKYKNFKTIPLDQPFGCSRKELNEFQEHLNRPAQLILRERVEFQTKHERATRKRFSLLGGSSVEKVFPESSVTAIPKRFQ